MVDCVFLWLMIRDDFWYIFHRSEFEAVSICSGTALYNPAFVCPARPAGRVTFVTLHVTLQWKRYLEVPNQPETTGVDVSQRGESIPHTLSLWGGLYIGQPENTLCHALPRSMSRPRVATYGCMAPLRRLSCRHTRARASPDFQFFWIFEVPHPTILMRPYVTQDPIGHKPQAALHQCIFEHTVFSQLDALSLSSKCTDGPVDKSNNSNKKCLRVRI